jgi:hypothetical protein
MDSFLKKLVSTTKNDQMTSPQNDKTNDVRTKNSQSSIGIENTSTNSASRKPSIEQDSYFYCM